MAATVTDAQIAKRRKKGQRDRGINLARELKELAENGPTPMLDPTREMQKSIRSGITRDLGNNEPWQKMLDPISRNSEPAQKALGAALIAHPLFVVPDFVPLGCQLVLCMLSS